MSWTLRPAWRSGRGSRGHESEAILDQIESLTSPGYTSYTPAWTSTGSAPAIGTSAITAKYRRSVDSDLVYVAFRITFAGATFGTGDYRFSVPVAASASAIEYATGSATLVDTGTTSRPGTVRFASSTTVLIDGTTGGVGQLSPHTWANTDIVIASIMYEPAS
jgi:hypothetical protein